MRYRKYPSNIKNQANQPENIEPLTKVQVVKNFLKKFLRKTWFILLPAFLYFCGPAIYRNYQLAIKITVISIAFTVAAWIAYKVFFYFFGCKVCNSSGKIDGHNNMLAINFEKDTCYVCGGAGIIFPSHNEWYRIALDADYQMKLHHKNCQELETQIQEYKANLKISSNLQDDHIHKRFEAQTKSLEKFLEFEKSQHELFKVIKVKAHLILHKKHLNKLQNRWEKLIARNGQNNIENYSLSISTGEDVRISNMFDSEVNYLSDYLDSVGEFEHTNDLISDVKKATEKLKKEFALH